MATERLENSVKMLITGPISIIFADLISFPNFLEISELKIKLINLNNDEKKLCSELYYYYMFFNKRVLNTYKFLTKIDKLVQRLMKIEKLDVEELYKIEMRKILNHIKDSIIFTNKCEPVEKLNIIQTVEVWISSKKKFLNIKEEQKIARKLFTITNYVNQFSISILLLKDENIKQKEVTIEGIISILAEYENFFSKENLEYLRNLVNDANLSHELKKKILNFLDSIDYHYSLPIASTYIDLTNDIFPDFFNFKFCSKEKGTILRNTFIINYSNTLESKRDELFLSDIDTQISIDTLAIVFVERMLSVYEELHDLLANDFKLDVQMKKIFTLKAFFIKFLRLDKLVQSLVMNLLIQIIEKNIQRVYSYIKKYFLEGKLEFEQLPIEYWNDFIDIASSPPFNKVLEQFLPTGSMNLKTCLEIMVSRTYLMKLPEELAGINLSTHFVLIKIYKKPQYIKASTFYIFIHESAHFLQRMGCITFADRNKSFSPKLKIWLDLNEDDDSNYYESYSNKEIKKILQSKFSQGNEDEKNEDIDEMYSNNKDNFSREEENELKNESDEEEVLSKSVNELEGMEKNIIEKKKIPKKKQLEQDNLDDNFKAKEIEGGVILETVLFGHQNEILYINGAKFLLSDLKQYKLPNFRREFNKRNIKMDGEKGQKFRSTSGYCVLGLCGFHL